MEKYFPSIDHDILMGLIVERIWDDGMLWLARTILEGSNRQPDVLHYFPGDSLFTPFDGGAAFRSGTRRASSSRTCISMVSIIM